MIDNYHKISCCFAEKVKKTYEARRFGITCHIESIKRNKEESFKLYQLMGIVEYINLRELQGVTLETVCDIDQIKEKINIL